MKHAYLAVLLIIAFVHALPRTAAALDNSDCFACHDDKSLAKTKPDGKSLSLYVNPDAYAASVHGSNACTTCHADITEAPHPSGFDAKPVSCAGCHERAASSYDASAHGVAARLGNKAAAHCSDCHGSHSIVRMTSHSSPLNHSNQSSTCGKCHAEVFQDIKDSIHGKAMVQGIPDAPTCTDCHADHRIENLRTASPMKIAEKVCSRCHDSERMNTRYRLPANRSSSFFDSYHGLAARLGSTDAANCASCHGFHKILPSSDPRSSVHPDNMQKTCRKCHAGANQNFSLGKVHVDNTTPPDLGGRINNAVRWVYLALIFGVIGGMIVHNILVFRKKLILAQRNMDKSVIRMTLSQRIQHWLLLVSFISLAVTGFALKYPDGWVAFLVGSNETVRRMGHRVAAVVMLGVALAHVIYLFTSRDGKKLLRDLLPNWSDLTGVLANLRYLIMPGAPKPAFGRFSYGEKAEYWAVVWGTIIMGLTGIMISFKMGMTNWMPRWVLDVAVTIHFYEAILAVLAIVVWHFYAVFLDPDIYPNNTAWLDGRVSEEWYKEEHALDTETLKQAEHLKANDNKPHTNRNHDK